MSWQARLLAPKKHSTRHQATDTAVITAISIASLAAKQAITSAPARTTCQAGERAEGRERGGGGRERGRKGGREGEEGGRGEGGREGEGRGEREIEGGMVKERGEREGERGREGLREREREKGGSGGGGGERERENSNSKTLFSKDCSLVSFRPV